MDAEKVAAEQASELAEVRRQAGATLGDALAAVEALLPSHHQDMALLETVMRCVACMHVPCSHMPLCTAV
jgi:hypothetical protein